MAKGLDPQVLTSTVLGVAEGVLERMNNVVATEPSQTKEVEIAEYQGRMRAMDMNDFQAPIYIAATNYYLSQGDLDRHKAKGSLVVYLDTENASKIYHAFGFKIPDDEDDSSMLDACGQVCNLMATSLNEELAKLGYANLVMSAPASYKNSIVEGVEYSPELKTKYQFSFFYWKRKVIVVEVTMAALPRK